MAGLPRQQDTTKPRDLFSLMVVDGIERTTNALRRGDPFSERGLGELQAIVRRLDALKSALDARTALLEDD